MWGGVGMCEHCELGLELWDCVCVGTCAGMGVGQLQG